MGRHAVDDWLEPSRLYYRQLGFFARIGLINQDKRGCGDDNANM